MGKSKSKIESATSAFSASLRWKLLVIWNLSFVIWAGMVDAEGIHWYDWGREPFDVAQKEDKLILLDLTAVWCHWCHVMDRETYENPEIARLINERFVPIRVDADRRPDVNDRYLSGGWPTTAFLTPGGEKIFARTYVPPEEMKSLLLQISEFYKSNRDSIEKEIASFYVKEEERRKKEAIPSRLSEETVEEILKSIMESFDSTYGGFGFKPKFPAPKSLELSLYYYHKGKDRRFLEIVRKSLDRMRQGLYDKEEGGFFRYSTTRDWKSPHFEKMLEGNAEILQNYLEAYQATGEKGFLETARGTLQYVVRTLFDNRKVGFYGSQDADAGNLAGEEYYRLKRKDRKRYSAPSVDETLYTDWNGKMIRSLLLASTVLREDLYREYGLNTLDRLWTETFREGKGMHHLLTKDGPQVEGILKDQVYVSLALLDAYEASGDPKYEKKAEALMKILIRDYEDTEGGGFFDLAEGKEALGAIKRREKNIEVNSDAVQGLVRLYHLTGEEKYRMKAEMTLKAFEDLALEGGILGAGYALALERFLSYPVKIVLVGEKGHPETQKLKREIQRLYEPRKVVKYLDPKVDLLQVGEITFPELEVPAVFVCIESLCSAPIEKAEGLRIAVNDFVQENL